MNDTLLWMMALPISIGIGLWFSTKNKVQQAWLPAVVNCVFGATVLAAMFFGSQSVATADTEIWSGAVTSKSRDHGTYEESYKCRCRNVSRSSGSGKDRRTWSEEVCDTCYRTHYTVNWNCNTSVGPFRIDSRDSLSSSVYSTPNPARWTSINVGDPASKTHSYTNYVQAVPESLFKPSSDSLIAKFVQLIPEYPLTVYDFYKIDRFLTPGYNSPDASAWNSDISMMLRDLGPKKQVNVIVVVVKTADPNYEYALRDAWEGANKNDVVLVIGTAAWPRIDFVRVISWTKNELFKVELRDSIQDLGMIQRAEVIRILHDQIEKNFVRRKMEEFKYLESEIDPPTWLLISGVITLLIAGFGTWVVLTNQFNRFNRRTSKKF